MVSLKKHVLVTRICSAKLSDFEIGVYSQGAMISEKHHYFQQVLSGFQYGEKFGCNDNSTLWMFWRMSQVARYFPASLLSSKKVMMVPSLISSTRRWRLHKTDSVSIVRGARSRISPTSGTLDQQPGAFREEPKSTFWAWLVVSRATPKSRFGKSCKVLLPFAQWYSPRSISSRLPSSGSTRSSSSS